MSQRQLFTDRFTAWKQFHAKNPHVYMAFKRLALTAFGQGRKVGARMIGERIRWDFEIEVEAEDGFKLNDHYWPYYSRLLAGSDHRFESFFVFKDKNFDTTIAEIVNYHNSLGSVCYSTKPIEADKESQPVE